MGGDEKCEEHSEMENLEKQTSFSLLFSILVLA